MRPLLSLCAVLLVLACSSDYASQCEEACNSRELKENLVRLLESQGQTVDEDTVCDRASIKAAESCDACRRAFLEEYGVEPVRNPADSCWCFCR